MSVESIGQAVEHDIATHGEPNFLTFAYGHLRESGVLNVDTEAEKYVLLTALNVVECIASAAPCAAS